MTILKCMRHRTFGGRHVNSSRRGRLQTGHAAVDFKAPEMNFVSVVCRPFAPEREQDGQDHRSDEQADEPEGREAAQDTVYAARASFPK